MTFTVRDWLTRSLRLLGQLGEGQTISNEAGADALLVASAMLDSWATERLNVYSQTRKVFALVNGQQRYTIGASGANWTQARPLWIDTAAVLINGQETEIRVFTRDQWAAVSQKSLTGAMPVGIFYNPTFPLGAIDAWPVPTDATVQIVLYTPLGELTSVSDLNTSLSVPEGWTKALHYNLAIELAPEYGVEPATPIVIGATDSKAAIQRVNVLNATENEARIDPALLSRRVISPINNYDDY